MSTTTKRDLLLARLAVASASVRDLQDDLQALLGLMIDPEEDRDGGSRKELFEQLEMDMHVGLVAVQAACALLDGMSRAELAQGEELEDDDDAGDD